MEFGDVLKINVLRLEAITRKSTMLEVSHPLVPPHPYSNINNWFLTNTYNHIMIIYLRHNRTLKTMVHITFMLPYSSKIFLISCRPMEKLRGEVMLGSTF